MNSGLLKQKQESNSQSGREQGKLNPEPATELQVRLSPPLREEMRKERSQLSRHNLTMAIEDNNAIGRLLGIAKKLSIIVNLKERQTRRW
ncbi:unnamed protein product [Linum trigynum]|uniref:Uncharacterized protein n=1 Tax=Linum trigynum TaxID=586398 RepID=A0AAV2DUX2_9ROSI